MTSTPDFTDLLRRDLTRYLESCGFAGDELERKADELMDSVKREASRFT